MARLKRKKLQIAKGEGGVPGEKYVPPKENPKKPWVPAPKKLAMKGPVLPKETSGGRYKGSGRPTSRPELPKETSGKRLAKATNKLSLPHLDEKIKNKKYLDNDKKLRAKYKWKA